MRDVAHDPRNGEYEVPSIQELRLRDLIYAATPRGLENPINYEKGHSDENDIDKCKDDDVITIDGEEIVRAMHKHKTANLDNDYVSNCNMDVKGGL